MELVVLVTHSMILVTGDGVVDPFEFDNDAWIFDDDFDDDGIYIIYQ
jgi:hypothetical protein